MAERTITGYQRLFEVRLLHHYWLDEGSTVFDALAEEKKEKYLLWYDSRSFLHVAPTTDTKKTLKGLRGVYRNTALGLVVAIPKVTSVPDDAVFEFVVTVHNADFFNYTALTLAGRKIYECYYPPEDKSYRYKENVPVLSNLTGVSRGAGDSQSRYLSREIPTLQPTDKVESLVVSGPALLQLTSDQPAALTQQLSAQATDMPVFVHQDDAPAIVPPAGLVGAPARGILLSDDMPDHVFALIRIAAVRPDNTDFSCTTGGLAKAVAPVFQIRFKNRSTFWRYYNKNTSAWVSTVPAPLPLTQYSEKNNGTLRKPTQGGVKVMFDNVVVTKINGLFSDIYE